MKKSIFTICALAALVSCQSLKEEWQPVFTGKYAEPASEKFYTAADFAPATITSIKDLKAMHKGSKVEIKEEIVISGYVVSSDHAGNVYRSIYVQDETGAIEVKTGRTSMYNELPFGQQVFIKCNGLVLGQYGGAFQLGLASVDPKYDTAYLDLASKVDAHVFKGYDKRRAEDLVMTISDSQIKDLNYVGRYVTVKDLTYANKIFVILYDKHDSPTYLRNKDNYGITTWAITEQGFKRYMETGFDGAIPAGSRDTFPAEAYTLSQYFTTPGGTELQVRTSGYAKFADTPIADAILKGAKVDLTGLLTYYNGNYQFTLLDLDGVQVK